MIESREEGRRAENAGDEFGDSVAVSRTTAVIGAPAKKVGTNDRQGQAYVFVRSGTTWTQQAILAAGGLSGTAGRKLYVLRQADNGLSDRLEVDTEELFQRSSLIWNIPIFPSDIVTVSVRVPVKAAAAMRRAANADLNTIRFPASTQTSSKPKCLGRTSPCPSCHLPIMQVT